MTLEREKVIINFMPSGRGKAKCPPNPNYPTGQELDLCGEKSGIWIDLPYPAPECGVFILWGERIGKVAITVAGRSDDPKRVKIPFRGLQ